MVASLFLYAHILVIPAMALMAQDRPPVHGKQVHIEVQVRRLSGDPIDGLRARDFTVVNRTTRKPLKILEDVRESTRSPDVRALVLFTTRSGYGSDAPVLAAIRSALPKELANMQVAFSRPDGRSTGYVPASLDTLKGLVSASGAQSSSGAIGELAAYHGRKVILYAVGAAQDVPPSIVRVADRIGALIYQIGGSTEQNFAIDPNDNVSPNAPGLAGSAAELVPSTAPHIGLENVPANLYEASKTPSVRTVRVEPSWKAALRDVKNDGRGYYNLTVDMAATTSGVELAVKKEANYQMSGEIYGSEDTPAPALFLSPPPK